MKYLQVYTKIFSVFLLTFILLFLPMPQNFLLFILTLPAAIYIWKKKTKTTDTHKQETDMSFPKLILITVGLSAFLIGILLTLLLFRQAKDPQAEPSSIPVAALMGNKQPAEKNIDEEKLLKELNQIKEELVQLRAEARGINQILGITSSPQQLSELLSSLDHSTTEQAENRTKGLLRVNDPKWKSVDVYQQPLASSRIVGKLEYGLTYPYLENTDSWYLVELDENTQGYVRSQFVSTDE